MSRYLELRKAAIQAAQHSYSPYSNCAVGSAILTDDNKMYSGCNIENASYGATVCAERVAIWKAISENKLARIKLIYVYTKDGWPPCGLCRQIMSEFADPELEIVIGNEEVQEEVIKFEDLMPHGFDKTKM